MPWDRWSFPFCSTTTRDKGYSPFARGPSQFSFLSTKQGSLLWLLTQSLHLCLSTWLENIVQSSKRSCTKNSIYFSILLRTREPRTLSFLLNGLLTDSCVSSALCPRFSRLFLPFPARFHGSDQEVSRRVLCPSPHLLLRKTSQLPLDW